MSREFTTSLVNVAAVVGAYGLLMVYSPVESTTFKISKITILPTFTGNIFIVRYTETVNFVQQTVPLIPNNTIIVGNTLTEVRPMRFIYGTDTLALPGGATNTLEVHSITNNVSKVIENLSYIGNVMATGVVLSPFQPLLGIYSDTLNASFRASIIGTVY